MNKKRILILLVSLMIVVNLGLIIFINKEEPTKQNTNSEYFAQICEFDEGLVLDRLDSLSYSTDTNYYTITRSGGEMEYIPCTWKWLNEKEYIKFMKSTDKTRESK